MKILLVLAGVLLLIAAAVASKKKSGSGSSETPWPFYAKRPLSQPEQVLYHRLVEALPDYIILAQVQASRILGVKRGNNFQEWNNRINRLSYDFVVCAKDSRVIAAIELDDKSHERASRVATDQKKDRATAAAGVKLIRWNVKALPDEATIRSEVASLPNVTVEEAGQTEAQRA